MKTDRAALRRAGFVGVGATGAVDNARRFLKNELARCGVFPVQQKSRWKNNLRISTKKALREPLARPLEGFLLLCGVILTAA